MGLKTDELLGYYSLVYLAKLPGPQYDRFRALVKEYEEQGIDPYKIKLVRVPWNRV